MNKAIFVGVRDEKHAKQGRKKMKNKLQKLFSVGLLSASAVYISMALMATGCSSINISSTGGDAEELSEVVESSSDEGASSSSVAQKDKKAKSSSSEKNEKTESSSSEKVESSDSEKAASSSSEKVEPKSSEAVESSSSEVIESSSSENDESSDTTEVASSSSGSNVEKKAADCSEKPFPEEFEYLEGRGENDKHKFVMCSNDSAIVRWSIHHTTQTDIAPASEAYALSRNEYDWGGDSLEFFKHDYLDKRTFDKEHVYEGVMNEDYQDFNCDASQLVGAEKRTYRYDKKIGDVYYMISAYPLTEVFMDENGNRTIRYGFTMELEAYYWAEDREKHLNKDSNKEG